MALWQRVNGRVTVLQAQSIAQHQIQELSPQQLDRKDSSHAQDVVRELWHKRG